MSRRIVSVLIGALFFTGCFRSVSYDTEYVLKPWVQTYNQGAVTSQPGVLAYAFTADTADWAPASYDDAAAGILTSRSDPSQRLTEPYATGVSFGEVDTVPDAVNWQKMRLKISSAMILAVDTESKLYAYTRQQLYENLSPLYISITFQPWRPFVRYSYGGWTYVNDFYNPDAPRKMLYTLKPNVQPTETDKAEPLAGAKVYAYAVDTARWRIASYADAAAGIITSKENAAERLETPTYTASPSSDSPAGAEWWSMVVTDDTLMVVTVDPLNKLYAYARQTVSPNAAPGVGTVTFCPWRPARIYTDGAWRMVNEFYVPETPETPDTPATPATPAKRRQR